MLILGSRLIGTPVMSLQTGTQLAKAVRPIIDPASLKIFAYEVEGPLLSERPSFIRISDIREMGGVGMIIDSNDEFIGLNDVIKLKELNDLGFVFIGMSVIDEQKHKLGKVEDYTLETNSFVIQQMHIKRGLFQGITDTGLLIHRSQIVEINDDNIIVKTTAKRVEPVMKKEVREYVNPFRSPSPQPDQRND